MRRIISGDEGRRQQQKITDLLANLSVDVVGHREEVGVQQSVGSLVELGAGDGARDQGLVLVDDLSGLLIGQALAVGLLGHAVVVLPAFRGGDGNGGQKGRDGGESELHYG